MNAVTYAAPHKVSISQVALPTIQNPTDATVKVQFAGLCGSDLHTYRGRESTPLGTIMGHELVGTVHEIGNQVKNFKIGQSVVSPFTISCGQCYYCTHGFSSRCDKGATLLGSAALPGAQAEYVRIPYADGTLISIPSVTPEMLLMADILPTGLFAAQRFLETHKDPKSFSVAIIGQGPVGQCATIATKWYGVENIYAIDTVTERLEIAKDLGVTTLHPERAATTLSSKIDIVLEVVGNASAISLAHEIVRPFGYISSVGVHDDNAALPVTGGQLYDKNVTLAFGRCPVRSLQPLALRVLDDMRPHLARIIQRQMPLSKAAEAYFMFEKQLCGKVVFLPDQ